MTQPPSPGHIALDIAIIGGGVAGLWLANRLKAQGLMTAVFEHKALGSDQTMASQGMIHGGMKYTLSGALTGASETIADMPNHWRACLCGEGDVDLRNTRILSDHFYLWSGNSITAKLGSFLASKAVRGRASPVPLEQCPPLLRHAEFEGNLYKLVDIVLDVHSLVTNLAHNLDGSCFQIDWAHAHLQRRENKLSLVLEDGENCYDITAQQFIFCAGKGNADLLTQLGIAQPAMQVRPLQQVLVRHQYPYAFYGHCLGAETSPRLTISSHKLNSGEQVWYLGGALAERGATLEPDALIEAAKQELAELLPWFDLSGADYATLRIDRAEPLQPNFIRPENAFAQAVKGIDNLVVAWPTKLTLAPNLANQILGMLPPELAIPGSVTPAPVSDALAQLKQLLPSPPIAATPWDLAFPPKLSAEEALNIRFFDMPPEATSPASKDDI